MAPMDPRSDLRLFAVPDPEDAPPRIVDLNEETSVAQLQAALEKRLEWLRWQLRNDLRDELQQCMQRSQPFGGGGDLGGTGGSYTPTDKDGPRHRNFHGPMEGGARNPHEVEEEFTLPEDLRPADSYDRRLRASESSAMGFLPTAATRAGNRPSVATGSLPLKSVDPKIEQRLQQRRRAKKSVFFGGNRKNGLSRRSSNFLYRISDKLSFGWGNKVGSLCPEEEVLEEEPRTCRGRARAFILGPDFDYMSGFLVIVNAIMLGVQTDWQAREMKETVHASFKWLEIIFCTLFTMELLCRIWAHGRNFLRVDWKWNVFDSVLVVMQLSELLLQLVNALMHRTDEASIVEAGNFNVVRILKIMRLVRVVRLMRVIRLVSELRALVMSIAGSLRSLVWAMLLLFVMMYIVGVYLTQLVFEYRLNAAGGVSRDSPLVEYWGSLGCAIYTLWGSVTGGVDWVTVVEPLRSQISNWMVPFFMLYTAFAILCMLNVITGVFVESALQSAKIDKDVYMIDHVRSLFQAFDQDANGVISWEEFQSVCGGGTNGLDSLLEELGMDRTEAECLFKLLDVDDTGSIDLNEFIHGCSRLRGPVKFLDFSLLQRHTTKLAEIQRLSALNTDRRLKTIDAHLDRINTSAAVSPADRSSGDSRPPVYPPPSWGILEEA